MHRRRQYPPMPISPVKPMPAPPQDYFDRFSPREALKKGTLFKWLYDPYEYQIQPPMPYNPYMAPMPMPNPNPYQMP